MKDLITGGMIVLLVEVIAIFMFMLWALMATGKQSDKRLRVPCLKIDGLECSEDCPDFSKHQVEREKAFYDSSEWAKAKKRQECKFVFNREICSKYCNEFKQCDYDGKYART